MKRTIIGDIFSGTNENLPHCAVQSRQKNYYLRLMACVGRAEKQAISHSLSRMDPNRILQAQYYRLIHFTTDRRFVNPWRGMRERSWILLFRIIELHHGRFTFRKLLRWNNDQRRPGDTYDWYVSIIICPFSFDHIFWNNARSLYIEIFFIYIYIYLSCFHRCISKLSTPPSHLSNIWMKCVHLSKRYSFTSYILNNVNNDLLNLQYSL